MVSASIDAACKLNGDNTILTIVDNEHDASKISLHINAQSALRQPNNHAQNSMISCHTRPAHLEFFNCIVNIGLLARRDNNLRAIKPELLRNGKTNAEMIVALIAK